jgi:hypothetical protein
MRSFLLILTLGFISFKSSGQQGLPPATAEDSVKAVINDMFTAMRTGDKKLFLSVFSDSVIMQTIRRNKEKKTIIVSESLDEFADFVGKLKKDSADERITFETVKIDGPLAIAWTPYKFYYNGKFSHCGVNSFQLIRFEGRWKIQYLIDTRRVEGCK